MKSADALRNAVRNVCAHCIALVTAVVLAGSGCGGGGSGGGGTGDSQPITPLQAAGRVILPPGFQGLPANLTVHTGLDKQPVAANGTFRVAVLGPGQGLATVTDASGKIVLMGYVDGAASGSPQAGGNGEISAQQTALSMLFYGTGAYTLPANLWQQARTLIVQSPQLAQVATVVAARVAADPTAVSDGDTALVSAVKQASAVLIGTGRLAGLPSKGTATSIRVAGAPVATQSQLSKFNITRVAGGRDTSSTLLLTQPFGVHSGIEALNDPKSGGIIFVNHLRRRAAAFIYETARQAPGENEKLEQIKPKQVTFTQSTVLSALGTAFGLNPPNTPSPALEVQPANALHGFLGSLTDVGTGMGAFTPVSTGPINLPQDGASVKTVYTVIIVGPAFQYKNSLDGFAPAQDADFAPFTAQWRSALTALTWEELILDIVVPVVSSIPLSDAANIKGVNANVILEIANTLSNIPDINASLANGDLKGAFSQIIQTLADNGTVRDAIVKAIYSQFTQSVTLEGGLLAAEEDLKGVLSSLAWIDLTLQVVDSSAVLIHSSTQNPVELWTATVVAKTVRLTPATATVYFNAPTVNLAATPGLHGDLNAPLVYHWSMTGTAGGGLEDNAHLSGHDKDFDSVDSLVTYALGPSARSGQTDTVTVEVFLNLGTFSHPQRGDLIGKAQSVVADKEPPCTVSGVQPVLSDCGNVTLSSTVVKPGGHLVVTVTLHNDAALGCGSDAQLSLNGTSVVSATINGMAVNTGDSVHIPAPAPGSKTITHTVDYVISFNAPDQCPSEVPYADPNLFIPRPVGPWAVLQYAGGGNSNGWTSMVPFQVQQ